MKHLIYLALFISLPGFTQQYYVDATVNSGGDGSKYKPFQTIQEAADVMQPGDLCLIAPGIYSESVRPSFSGTEDRPIIFKPSGKKGSVIITGADPVAPERWEKRKGGFFRAEIEMEMEHENQVFLGDHMLIEARWPNSGSDPLIPTLAVMEKGSTPDMIVDPDLPDLDWSGAGVWVHAPKYWSDWTTRVISFAKGSLVIEDLAPFPAPKRHVTTPGADYFLYGCLAALDTTNEWYYDNTEGYLYIYRPEGTFPSEPFYIKRRHLAFDLSGLSNIQIMDIDIFAATIATDSKSEKVILDGLEILYPYHSSEANRLYRSPVGTGVMILGKHCEVRNCEIAYSAASGIVLDGKYNLVYNCYIHDTDYLGTYASCVTLRGKGNIVSHCTLCRSGRSMIDYGGMQKALIQFCDMYHAGMLTSDNGLTYGNVIEGDGTEVRYNWMHDNLAPHLNMGLYYDHGTQNIVSHHNVIWGVSFSGFHINHYAQYHLAYNNTFTSDDYGFRSDWGNQYLPDLHGSRFFNNIFTRYSLTSAGNYAWGNNMQNYEGLIDNKFLEPTSKCIDAGIVVKGINDAYIGKAPDLGAYEFGGVNWRAGHNFGNPPLLDTTRSKPLHRNRLENAAFEHEDHIRPWVTSGQVEVERDHKGQGTPDTATIRMGAASLMLGARSEVFQTVTGLEPGSWYELAAFLRVDKGELACIGVRDSHDGEQQSPFMENKAPYWYRVLVRFRTAPDQTKATVYLRRVSDGKGKVFVDDCGLIYLHKN